MSKPFQCAKCGTIFAPNAVGLRSPAISACTVCGASLVLRSSARDPESSRTFLYWGWIIESGAIVAIVAGILFGLVALVKLVMFT